MQYDLDQCALFEGVAAADLQNIIENNKIITAKKGEIIFEHGERGDSMCIILEGSCDVMVEHIGPLKNKVIATIEKNSFFGEVCMLETQTRIASVKATSDSQLLLLDGHAFREKVQQQDLTALRISHNIAIALAGRLRKANELITELFQNPQLSGTSEITQYRQRFFTETLF